MDFATFRPMQAASLDNIFGLLFRVVGNDGEDRSKDFVLRNGHLVIHLTGHRAAQLANICEALLGETMKCLAVERISGKKTSVERSPREFLVDTSRTRTRQMAEVSSSNQCYTIGVKGKVGLYIF